MTNCKAVHCVERVAFFSPLPNGCKSSAQINYVSNGFLAQ